MKTNKQIIDLFNQIIKVIPEFDIQILKMNNDELHDLRGKYINQELFESYLYAYIYEWKFNKGSRDKIFNLLNNDIFLSLRNIYLKIQ